MAVLAAGARLGFIADLLSRPVLVGYLAGVALMIAGQLGAATGVPVAGRAFPAQVASFAERIGGIGAAPVTIAAAVPALLFLARWRWPRVPGPLVAVLLATAAVAAFSLERHGVAVAGQIPPGLPHAAIPSLRDAQKLLLPAFSVLIVAFSDDVLTARAFARRDEQI